MTTTPLGWPKHIVIESKKLKMGRAMVCSHELSPSAVSRKCTINLAKAPWLECALDGAKLLHTVPVLALPHTEGAPIYIGRLQVCKPISKAARASPPPLHIALPRSAFEPCITGVDGYEAGMRVHLAGYRCREKGNRMPRALLLQVVRAGVPPRSHGRATLTAVGMPASPAPAGARPDPLATQPVPDVPGRTPAAAGRPIKRERTPSPAAEAGHRCTHGGSAEAWTPWPLGAACPPSLRTDTIVEPAASDNTAPDAEGGPAHAQNPAPTAARHASKAVRRERGEPGSKAGSAKRHRALQPPALAARDRPVAASGRASQKPCPPAAAISPPEREAAAEAPRGTARQASAAEGVTKAQKRAREAAQEETVQPKAVKKGPVRSEAAQTKDARKSAARKAAAQAEAAMQEAARKEAARKEAARQRAARAEAAQQRHRSVTPRPSSSGSEASRGGGSAQSSGGAAAAQAEGCSSGGDDEREGDTDSGEGRDEASDSASEEAASEEDGKAAVTDGARKRRHELPRVTLTSLAPARPEKEKRPGKGVKVRKRLKAARDSRITAATSDKGDTAAAGEEAPGLAELQAYVTILWKKVERLEAHERRRR